MYDIYAYVAYLIVSIGLTIWVAQTLSKNGLVFLVECFGHDRTLAESTNHLLVVGFYLVNLGWILLTLRFGASPETAADMIRFLSTKIGMVVVAALVLSGCTSSGQDELRAWMQSERNGIKPSRLATNYQSSNQKN